MEIWRECCWQPSSSPYAVSTTRSAPRCPRRRPKTKNSSVLLPGRTSRILRPFKVSRTFSRSSGRESRPWWSCTIEIAYSLACTAFSLSLSVNSFRDVSEANGRETPRQKQNAHACVTFLKFKDDVNVVSRKQAGSKRFWSLTTLVDICRIDFYRPAWKSYQNVIHSPMKIYTALSISSFQLSYRSLSLANFQGKHNIDPCVVKLDLKSWIIRKTILSNKIHKLRIKKCQETESKSKNPMKFADIHRSDACIINVRSIKFNLHALSQDRVLSKC